MLLDSRTTVETSGGSSPFTSTIVAEVRRGDANNPFNSTTGLTFTYLVSNAANSQSSIRRVSMDCFAGWLVDITYDTTVGTQAPQTFDRSAAEVNNGDVLGANYTIPPESNGINAGETAFRIVVHTNATNFVRFDEVVHAIDGGANNHDAFCPVEVPEPTSLALAIVGIPVVGGYALRRFRRNKEQAAPM
jgi:hypothetical protein